MWVVGGLLFSSSRMNGFSALDDKREAAAIYLVMQIYLKRSSLSDLSFLGKCFGNNLFPCIFLFSDANLFEAIFSFRSERVLLHHLHLLLGLCLCLGFQALVVESNLGNITLVLFYFLNPWLLYIWLKG